MRKNNEINLSSKISETKDVSKVMMSDIFEEAKKDGTCYILLVEDHTMSRMLVKRFLVKCGYTVDAVEDGESALLLIEISHYDLILMNLGLPGIDGYETTRSIRATENINSDIPILALTSLSEKEVNKKMDKVGINDYIGKPFNPEELYKKVKHYAFDKRF